VFLESSENYKQFLRSAWELFFKGPRVNSLVSTLNALFGLPTIIEEVEVFQRTLIEGEEKKVVTDKNTYSFSLATPLRGDLTTDLVLNAGDPLTEVVRIFDDTSHPSWWRNYAFLPIPVRILTEEHFSDLIAFNRSKTAPIFIGAKIPLDVGGSMTASRRAEFDDFILPVGAGWSIGDTSFTYLTLDLLFQFFFKAHLFLLSINANHISAERLTSKVVDLLNEAIPAYTYFININDLAFVDEYTLDTDADELAWEFGRAHLYTDDFTAIDDGYQSRGPWLIGYDGIVLADPPLVFVGGSGFQPGMRWYIRRMPC
jgi:hypothetical protein